MQSNLSLQKAGQLMTAERKNYGRKRLEKRIAKWHKESFRGVVYIYYTDYGDSFLGG